jgi:hypothetical protein
VIADLPQCQGVLFRPHTSADFVSGTSHHSFWNTSITSCPFNDFHTPLFGFTGCTKCMAKSMGIANKLHSEMVSGSNISCEMETCSSNEFVEQIYADIMAEGEQSWVCGK